MLWIIINVLIITVRGSTSDVGILTSRVDPHTVSVSPLSAKTIYAFLIGFIRILNYSYRKRNACLNIKIDKCWSQIKKI